MKRAFFITFTGLSVAKNCLRPESAPLRIISFKQFMEPSELLYNQVKINIV